MVKKGWFKEPARHSLAARGLKTRKVPYKSATTSKRVKLKWKPSDKRTINVTYDIVTQESAKDGAVAESGFEKEGVQIESIDDILSVFEYGKMEGDGYSLYAVDSEPNYQDGSEKRYGIHFSRTFTPDEINRIYDELIKKKLVYTYPNKSKKEPDEYFRRRHNLAVRRRKDGKFGKAEDNKLLPGRDYDDRCDIENPEC
jgi:hypothetical protein